MINNLQRIGVISTRFKAKSVLFLTQILNVVNEAHAMLGLPAWGPASGGTLSEQVTAVCAMLGV